MSKKLLCVLMSFGLTLNVSTLADDSREDLVGSKIDTVTYVYEYVSGMGGDDPEFLKTGVIANYYLEIIFIVSLLALITVVKIKNKLSNNYWFQ